MQYWYNITWSEVVKKLDSNEIRGLDLKQVEESREKNGRNIMLVPKGKGLIRLIISEMKNLWFLLLIMDFIIFSYIKEFKASIILLTFIIISIFITVYDKYKEEKNCKTIERFNVVTTTVIRNGEIKTVEAKEIVVGDIVVFDKGSVIPADLRIVESENLRINEFSVTGSTLIVEKYQTKIEDRDISLTEMKNIAFKSSVVVEGEGTGIVIEIGMNSEIGKIIEGLFKYNVDSSTFEQGVYEIVNSWSKIVLAGSVLCLIINKINNVKILSAITEMAYIVLCSIPEAIIVVFFIISLIIKRNFKKDFINIKNMTVIQRLSSINVLCTDKEQAFTVDKIIIKRVYDNIHVKAPYVDINMEEEEKENEDNADNFNRILQIGLLCSDIKINHETGKLIGDLVEYSIMEYAMKNDIRKPSLDRKNIRIFQIPYEPERRIKTTVNKIGKKYRANVKGAVDVILNKCTHIMKNGIEREITDEDIREIRNADIEMSNDCLNVMGFAYRNFNYGPSPDENIESNLVFAGLVGFENNIKESAYEALEICKNTLVKPIIITEDSKLTALAVGKKLGVISNEEGVISGIEMDYMKADELERTIHKVTIYSRITSEHKRKIVECFKKSRFKVAVSGSKLLDLSILKISDIFFSIGERCSSTIKKLSDIYLLENDFFKLLKLVEKSRMIIASLKRIIIYYIAFSISEFVLIMLTVIFRNFTPLDMNQILWLNIGNIIISTLAILSDSKYNQDKKYDNSVIDKSFFKKNKGSIMSYGIIMGIGAYLAFIMQIDNKILARTSCFTVIALSQILLLYREGFFKNIYFNMLTLVNILIQGVIIFTPIGKLFLNLESLSGYMIKTILVIIVIEMFLFAFIGASIYSKDDNEIYE